MSSATPPPEDFYVVGGTMQPSAPSYVERAADRELYERVLAGDFCYVLTPRQMGKSSLMARTAARLRAQGIGVAIVDLTKTGGDKNEMTADQWYFGVARTIARELKLTVNLSTWWQERERLPPLQRLSEFFSDLVLAQTDQPVVIFVDEIDTTLNLPFTDDFFAAIRACYNARATDTQYQRLTFVLLGVASPSELAKDPRRTPFNIGRRIDLSDFTFDEAQPLARGLGSNGNDGEQALRRILHWTNGHPYLTQKLSSAVAENCTNGSSERAIDGRVEQLFFGVPTAQQKDDNLAVVRDRLVSDKEHGLALLQLYRRICQGRAITDNPRDTLHAELKLSGLVVPQTDGVLRVRNRIYERVFTPDWAKAAMPTDTNRRIAISAVAALLIGIISWYTLLLPRPYITTLMTASEDVPVARAAYERLHALPGYAGKADQLWADFWQRRALRAEMVGERDPALLYWLQAVVALPQNNTRSEAHRLSGADYASLLATYRHAASVNVVAFSPDGQTVVTGSGDRTARLWRADSGAPVGQVLQHDGAV